MPLHHTVIVPVNGITKATAGALVYATTISDEVLRGVRRGRHARDGASCSAQWEAWDIGVPLVVLPSPYRSILRPLVEYVENLRMVTPGELVTVVVPEVVPRRWWEHLLHNKTALYIRTAFLFKPNVVVTACRTCSATRTGCAICSSTTTSSTTRRFAAADPVPNSGPRRAINE